MLRIYMYIYADIMLRQMSALKENHEEYKILPFCEHNLSK